MGIEQAGAIVTSVKDSEVLALVGSLGYGRTYLGFNNAVLARRSAGSILKPFLYALALEQGRSSFSEIPDTLRTYPTPQGDYQPFNVDRRWYGPVNVRLCSRQLTQYAGCKNTQGYRARRVFSTC